VLILKGLGVNITSLNSDQFAAVPCNPNLLPLGAQTLNRRPKKEKAGDGSRYSSIDLYKKILAEGAA
jgi:hypothetical protein